MREMHDCFGKKMEIGDTVAVVFSVRAEHRNFVSPGVIAERKGEAQLFVETLDKHEKLHFAVNGSTYARLVLIDPAFPEVPEGTPKDAVGHAIHEGDKIVCTKPSQRLSHAITGFMKGGVVTGFTNSFVIYTDENGESHRKGYNGAVVVQS